MTAVGSGATRWGVRVRDALEIRRIMIGASLLVFANALTNWLFPLTFDAGVTLAHPDAYSWTAPVLAFLGLACAIAFAVPFCDLRGFTAFAKQVEPEEVMEVSTPATPRRKSRSPVMLKGFGEPVGNYLVDRT